MRPFLQRGPLTLALLVLVAGFPAAASAATEAQTIATLKQIARAMPSGSGVYAHEAATGITLASRSPSTARVPASVTKLFTTATALMTDGPSTTLTTSIRMLGTLNDGALDGDLVVHGDGDPAFRLDEIDDLADAVKARGVTKIDGGLRADVGSWSSDQGTPLTGGAYNREIGGRLGPLVTLRGFASATVTDPAKQVLVKLRTALKARNIAGSMPIGAPMTDDPGAVLITEVESPTIQQLVASTLAPSDNFYAEMLLRGVGARHGAAGTTEAGLAVERAQLAKLGVSAKLFDGSGLSHSNRVTPATVVKLLDKMATRPEAAALRTGMALAGATGTVAARMRGTAAAGRCRLKTGTLSNVSALAGYCTTLGKRQVTFAVINNHTSVASARSLQDRVASALASWSDPVSDVAVTPTPVATTPKATSPSSANAATGATGPTGATGTAGGVSN